MINGRITPESMGETFWNQWANKNGITWRNKRNMHRFRNKKNYCRACGDKIINDANTVLNDLKIEWNKP